MKATKINISPVVQPVVGNIVLHAENIKAALTQYVRQRLPRALRGTEFRIPGEFQTIVIPVTRMGGVKQRVPTDKKTVRAARPGATAPRA